MWNINGKAVKRVQSIRGSAYYILHYNMSDWIYRCFFLFNIDSMIFTYNLIKIHVCMFGFPTKIAARLRHLTDWPTVHRQ